MQLDLVARRVQRIGASGAISRVAFLLCFVLCSQAAAQEVDSFRTVNHPLQFGRTPSASLANSEADDIVSLGNQILAQCNSVFRRSGQVVSSGAIPSTINGEADMDAACNVSAAGDYEPSLLGTPRRVRVVNAINWCGTAGTQIVGCARTPGTCLIVRRYSPLLEGILLAHEFGHSKRLQHVNRESAVMNPTISSLRTMFTNEECGYIRSLSLTTTRGVPVPQNEALDLSIEEFVSRIYFDGMPYDEARLYSNSEVERVVAWLREDAKAEYWGNILATVGIVAGHDAYNVLRGFILRANDQPISLTEYDAKTSAIISLGYAARGSGSSEARMFLEQHIQPSAWESTSWKAPYHETDSQRNVDLAAAAILGLSLTDDEAVLQSLKAVKFIAVSEEGRQVLQRAQSQAITDIELRSFRRVPVRD